MKKTTIYLPDEMMVEIKTVSKQERRSEAELIREALDKYLAGRRRPLPSIFGMGAGGAVTGAESEDWLNENWDVD
jgi:metal-responsive CopG/Arc/MetJ family transcriptional regulator